MDFDMSPAEKGTMLMDLQPYNNIAGILLHNHYLVYEQKMTTGSRYLQVW